MTPIGLNTVFRPTFMAEGRAALLAQARYVLDLSALAVVTGSAIIWPDVITRGFTEALNLPGGHGEP